MENKEETNKWFKVSFNAKYPEDYFKEFGYPDNVFALRELLFPNEVIISNLVTMEEKINDTRDKI